MDITHPRSRALKVAISNLEGYTEETLSEIIPHAVGQITANVIFSSLHWQVHRDPPCPPRAAADSVTRQLTAFAAKKAISLPAVVGQRRLALQSRRINRRKKSKFGDDVGDRITGFPEPTRNPLHFLPLYLTYLGEDA